MFKLYAYILDKLGVWFGIIFKMVLPFLVMYRPIKTFAFSIVVVGTYYMGSSPSLNTFGIVLFYLIYAVLLALLIWFPKVASAVEFVLIGVYFAFIGGLYVLGFYSSFVRSMAPFLHIYIKELPFVAVFFVGKILFFFFLLSNRKDIEEMKREDNQLLYHSDCSDYLL